MYGARDWVAMDWTDRRELLRCAADGNDRAQGAAARAPRDANDAEAMKG